MRGESHRKLGLYLADQYMQGIPKDCVNAFLLGCIQPDRNPATYLKGSLRFQWLRGHNYENARRFMARISRRLERKTYWSLYDYYTLGKLIHYTADAFTFAHNSAFSADLKEHMEYEYALQEYFLRYLTEDPPVDIQSEKTIMQTIALRHRDYSAAPADICRDSRYALSACCCVLVILFLKPI